MSKKNRKSTQGKDIQLGGVSRLPSDPEGRRYKIAYKIKNLNIKPIDPELEYNLNRNFVSDENKAAIHRIHNVDDQHHLVASHYR